MENIKQTAYFWDQRESYRPRQFWDLPVIGKYRNRLISGDENLGYLQWFSQKYLQTAFKSGISLGCGSGSLERTAISLGIAEKMTGIDVAPGRLKKAAELSTLMPIEYRLQNLNSITLPENTYDFSICKMILHHVKNLELLLCELKKSLIPGALIYVDEYVGPRQFQFSEKILQTGDKVLQEIPFELRRLHFDPTKIKTRINRIDPELINLSDPSEAIRSDEIDSLLKKHFTLLEEHGTGGTLLFRLLDGIAHNFEADNNQHNEILQVLCRFEKNLTDSKLLPEIFKIYVFRNDK